MVQVRHKVIPERDAGPGGEGGGAHGHGAQSDLAADTDPSSWGGRRTAGVEVVEHVAVRLAAEREDEPFVVERAAEARACVWSPIVLLKRGWLVEGKRSHGS